MNDKSFAMDIALIANRNAKEKEYWLNKLAGRPGRTSFPYDFNKIEQGKRDDNDRPLERIEHMEFEVSGGDFEKLMWIANNSDLRLFMILVTGLMVLLAKHTGQEDILVGAPIEKQEVEADFLNTLLALRAQLDAGMTFKELLLQVRQVILEAGENQNFPIERIPYELNIDVQKNDAFALFDTAVLLENIHDRNYIAHVQLNMLFSFVRTAESIEGVVEYNSALYKRETIQVITGHFVHLFREIVANLNIPIIKLNIMPEYERKFLLVRINETWAEYPNAAIHELFEEQVEKMPGHIAVEEADTGRTIIYKELNRRANQLANLLQEKGVIPGAVVAVMGERTGDIVTSILAILKARGVFLPLDAQNPNERLYFILKDSGANIIISQRRIIAEREDLFKGFSPGNIIAMDDDIIYEGDMGNPSKIMNPSHPAYIIYTSGTTGKPKGVIVEQKSLVNYINFAVNNYIKDESLNFPLYTSIAFDLTITSIFTPLVTGNAVVVYSGWNKGNLIERIIDDKKVGVIKLTPSLLSLIGEKKMADSSHKIKCFIVGGETLNYQIARDVNDNFNGKVKIYNEYGPTEATVGCMLYKFDPVKDKDKGSSVSIGGPAANAQIYLLDKNQEPVAIGAIGEVYIGGDGLARGYLNHPELTENKFIRFHHSSFIVHRSKLLYKTGDLARWMSDGNIEFLGRIDQQVKIRGFRIELGEIENRLLKHDAVKEAVVIIKEASGDKHICVYIVSGRELSIPELKDYLTRELPDYMVPTYFIQLDAIPLTPNGKVDMKALPEPETKTQAIYVAPRNETEKKLVAIWSEILGLNIELIGIDSNFFELGGHSLSGTVLNAKIHKTFNVKLALADLFRLPTIRELSQLLEKSMKIEFISIEPVEEKEYYPLSSAQERLFIIQQMDPDSTGYNVPMVYEIQGRLIMEKLQDVFRKLIHRHDNLRTSFILIDDKPVQWIHKESKFEIEYFDLTGIESIACEAEIQRLIKSFIRPFNFSQSPLLRVGLIHTEYSSERFILIMDTHHIITDSVSMDILMKEIGALYVGHQLEPLKLHYKDFSEWQNSVKIKEEMKKQETYWLKQFEGEIPVLQLPTDFPRPLLQSFEGDRIHFELKGFEITGLRGLAAAQGVTLFMVILSLYNIFLSKVSGQEDIVVGTSIAGRRHTDLEYIMGIFINTLALRNYPNGEKPFLEFLQEIKINTLNAYENQEYQYEELVTRVQVRRDTSRNPLLDTMFALNNVDTHYLNIPQFEIPNLKIIPYKSDFLISKMDILLDGFDDSKNISFNLEYSTKLFKKETIMVFLRYFKQVVANILANPGQKIWEIEILSNEEKKHLLSDFNDTVTDFPADSTIHQLFQEQVERIPNNIAVVGPFANQIHIILHITYKELNEKANQLAHVLREKSIKSDSIITIMMERSIEMMIGIMGILKSGGAYLPIDLNYPQGRIEFMLKDSGSQSLVTTNNKESEKVKRWKSEKNFEIVCLNSFYSSSFPTVYLPNFLSSNPSSLAYVIYTSGSTGKPKGVLIRHQSVVNMVWFHRKVFKENPGSRISQAASAVFDAMAFEVWPCLLSGACLCIIDNEIRMQAVQLKEWLIQFQVTISFQPTLIAQELLREQWPETGVSLEVLRTAGDKLTFHPTHSYPFRFYNLYGPTEDTIWTTWTEVPVISPIEENCPPSIGKPIANHKVYILNSSLTLQPVGILGELCISGVGLAQGYLNNPELTAEKFNQDLLDNNENWHEKNKSFSGGSGGLFFKKAPLVTYRTGDLARWLSDGCIEFSGRIDHQVKVRGFRIELGEIESRLLQHEEIYDAVVIEKESGAGGIELCAYLVSARTLTTPELREYLGLTLPHYMIPSHFVSVERIPVTPSGKVDKRMLATIVPSINTGKEFVPAQTELQKAIAGIWQEVLGMPSVSITDNFFDLGGNSLKVITLNSKLNEVLGMNISVIEMFKYTTIQTFIDYIGAKNKTGISPALDNKNMTETLSKAEGLLHSAIGMLGGK